MKKLLRYSDLIDLNIINNNTTLNRWIRQRGFPPARLLGPNTRVWSENDIQKWIACRPRGKANGNEGAR